MVETETRRNHLERREIFNLLSGKPAPGTFEATRARIRDALLRGVITMPAIHEYVVNRKDGPSLFWYAKGATKRSFWMKKAMEDKVDLNQKSKI